MNKVFPIVLTFMLLFITSGSVFGQDVKPDIKAELETLNQQKSDANKKAIELQRQIAELQKNSTKGNYIDTTQMIIYNFKTKSYLKSNVRPRNGEPIVFKIMNINRLAYEISIKSSDVAILDENFDEEFKIISNTPATTGTINTVPAKKDFNLNTATLKLSSSTTKSKEEISPTEATQFESDLLSLEKQIQTKNEALFRLKERTIEIKSKSDPTSELTTELAENQKKEIALRDELLDLNFKYQISLNKLKQYRKTEQAIADSFTELRTKYIQLLQNITILNKINTDYSAYRTIALNPILIKSDYSKNEDLKDLLKERTYFNSIDNFETDLSSFYGIYNSKINDYETLLSLDPSSREIILLNYQLIKEEVDKIKLLFDESDFKNKILKARAMDAILTKDEAYNIVSSPIQPYEDYVVFDVSIKHRDGSSEYNDDREFKYSEYTRGGIRFDFSTGAVFDFPLDKNDRDDDDYYDEYNVKTIIDAQGVTRERIIGVSRNDFIPSLAGMFHMSFRSAKLWAFGFTLGASLNVETFELNSLFPGVSLLMGKKQKFIVTLGPSFRQKDILKKNFSLNEDYEEGTFGDGTELTTKQFKIGLFFGLTYNLTQKQRGKFKINGGTTDGE